MFFCCIDCFSNKAIEEYIDTGGEQGNCDYCHGICVKTLSVGIVGDFIRQGLFRAYEHVESAGIYWNSEDKSCIVGEHATEVLNEIDILSDKVFSCNCNEELLCDLLSESGPSEYDLRDGAEDWLDGGDALIILRNEFCKDEDNRFNNAWRAFKYSVKHFARFFDLEEDGDKKEDLLNILGELLHEMDFTLERGTLLWRARPKEGELGATPQEIQKTMGPPPVKISKHNRMSPAGMSYMYLSDKEGTCLAEIRPSGGEEIWVGEFEIKKDLKILDLTHIPWFGIKSIFEVDYDHDMLWAKSFMDSFSAEISTPLAPSETPIEYVPTQVFSEFIRKKGYVGIKFNSSIKNGGVNYTLFIGPEVDDYLGWLERGFQNLSEYTGYVFLRRFKAVRPISIDVAVETAWNSEKEFQESDFFEKESRQQEIYK